MTMRLVHTYFCRMQKTPLPGTLESYIAPIRPSESGSRSDAVFTEYKPTVRDNLAKRFDVMRDEISAVLEGQDGWEMRVEDEAIEELEVEDMDINFEDMEGEDIEPE